MVILHQLNKLSVCLVSRLARRDEIPDQLIGSGTIHVGLGKLFPEQFENNRY